MRREALSFPRRLTRPGNIGQHPMRTARCQRHIPCRQPTPVPRQFPGMGHPRNQVRPLPRIRPQVIKFLGSIRVSDVTPVLGSHRMIASVVGGDRRTFPHRRRILQLRQQAGSLSSRRHRQSGQRRQRRQHPTHLRIHECRARQITPAQIPPLPILLQPRQARLRQPPMQVPGKARCPPITPTQSLRSSMAMNNTFGRDACAASGTAANDSVNTHPIHAPTRPIHRHNPCPFLRILMG